MTRPKKPAKSERTTSKPRVRRSPEEARAAILEAAERVFAKHLPDAVGLKDVATEAGVSHALVTHYFGTYGNLVEATLEQRIQRLRETVTGGLFAAIAGGVNDASALFAAYRRALAEVAREPVTMRLAAWAILSGRIDRDDFVAHRLQGLRMLADALEAKTELPREDLEFGILVSFALTVAWSVGRRPLSAALGREATRDRDADFEARTARMLDAFLATARRP